MRSSSGFLPWCALALGAGVIANAATASAGQRESHGVEPRVTALEEQVAALTQQAAGLTSQLTATEQQLAGALARVTALENLWQPRNFNVNCADGQTVRDALFEANKRTGRVTIRVIGTCVEAVQFDRSNTTIRGAAPGDGLTAPSSTSTVMGINAARNVVLDNLALTGGLIGLSVRNDAQVIVRNSVIANHSFLGATADHGTLEFQNTTVENNHDGITAWLGSTVKIVGGRIQNERIGIGLYTGSRVLLDGSSLVTGNQSGVNVRCGSVLNVRSARIEANGEGISAIGGATVLIGTETIIQNNQGNGLSLQDTSVVGVLGSDQAQIINNRR